jgi:hypothetical protein
MLNFLHDAAMVKISNTMQERDVDQIEVFGRCRDMAEIEAKAIQLASEKQREYPVIIILPTINDCERLKL